MRRLIVKFALSNLKIPQYKLAKIVGVKPINIRRYIAGTESLSKKQEAKLAKILKLNICRLGTQRTETRGECGVPPWDY